MNPNQIEELAVLHSRLFYLIGIDRKRGDGLMLSVIIPAYNEAQNIPRTAKVISNLLQSQQIEHELIFVDDGSQDGSFGTATQIQRDLPQVRCLKFTRNFGKEAAIMAGLAAAEGACCAVIDCDLQHPPECLPKMYRLWQQGYLVVEGIKADRGKEGAIYGFFAKTFYRLVKAFSGFDLAQASDFKLLDRRVVDLLLALPEREPFFRGLSAYFGFPKTQVQFQTAPRTEGKTKWTALGLLRYAFNNLTSFSVLPLQAVTALGCLLLVVFFILGFQTLYNYCFGYAIAGFTTVILLQLLIGSGLLISLGIIGHYIARIYNEVKGRPRYVIERELKPIISKPLPQDQGQAHG